MIKSIYSDKTEIRNSEINGKGLYAKRKIYKDETVAVKGGYLLTKNQVKNEDIVANGFWPLDDNYYLGTLNKDEQQEVLVYMNHSCEPNCGIKGNILFVAMRDIEVDEELTLDYAIIDNENYSFNCTCKAKSCRKVLTGKDWMKKDLQEKYNGYFASYLQDKIEKLKKVN